MISLLKVDKVTRNGWLIMGLDVSHGCWSGAYSAFNRWREKIAEVAGLPPLGLMEFYYPSMHNDLAKIAEFIDATPISFIGNRLKEYDQSLPIKWDALKPDVLHVLLNHSDSDGLIGVEYLTPLADRLEELLPLLEGDGGGHIGSYQEKTQAFINGLRLAASLNEPVVFA